MPEEQVINTRTIVTVTGSDIEIFTEYDDELGDILQAAIALVVGVKDGTSFIEGEGLLTCKDDFDIIAFVNANGELVLIDDDADRYEIDVTGSGQLTYTIP